VNLAHGAAAKIGAYQRHRLLGALRAVERERSGQFAQPGADQRAQMTHGVSLLASHEQLVVVTKQIAKPIDRRFDPIARQLIGRQVLLVVRQQETTLTRLRIR